jgi:hypothetical protein
MNLTLNKFDFRIENSEIVMKINGWEAGNITEIPSNELSDAVEISQMYAEMYECIKLYNCMPISINISYSNLFKIYSIYHDSRIEQIKNTLTIFRGTEIVAVIVGTKKDILNMPSEIILKGVVYHYVNCEYNAYVVEGRTLVYFCRDFDF